MSVPFIRVYEQLDPGKIKPNLLIYGDISGSCASCSKIDCKLEMEQCPQCGAVFNYIAFRNVKSHLPKMYKLLERRPNLKFIDYDDYNRTGAQQKAKDLLK